MSWSLSSTMLTLLSRSQADTRDNVQAREDSYEVGKADRAIRQNKSTIKMQVQEQCQLSGKGNLGKTLKNIHTASHEHWLIHAAALDLFPNWC